MKKVICLGEALVDFISLEPAESLKQAERFVRAPGGAVCNVAVGLARLGINVRLITKLGIDPFGQFMADFLKSERVDVSKIKFTSEHLTPLVFVSLDRERNPSFFFYGEPGADRLLSPDEISEKDLEDAEIFHFGTVSLSIEPVRSATLKALELAEKRKMLISFDPNFRLHLWEDPQELKGLTQRLVSRSHLIKLNLEELAFLTGFTAPEKGAKTVIDAGAKVVLITLGEKGAYFATKDYDGYVPAFKVNPVDTTGAGDAFISAMIAWLARFKEIPPEKDELEQAVRFANAFAGLSTEKFGAIAGLCSWEEVELFIKKSS